jgi:hypothetical protein
MNMLSSLVNVELVQLEHGIVSSVEKNVKNTQTRNDTFVDFVDVRAQISGTLRTE